MKTSIFTLLIFAVISCSPQSSSNPEEINHTSFASSLDSMMKLDQGFRKQISEAMKSNLSLPTSIYQEMEKVDSSNQAWLKIKLEKNGWPEKSKIGEKAARAVFLLIQHADLPDIETYYPQLQSLADMGKQVKSMQP
ncbi:DUF6624 domain-containing protein [Belliella marina]|uniref:DUF6624 domain-containing protein n=1 Tax=Belliella marina TaxID=1644146 RepID=A0ABW4VLV2_9BACT